MTVGVECWNAAGQKTLDINTRIAKFFGVAQIGNSFTGSATSGTIVDSRFTAYSGTTPFYFILGGSLDFEGNTAQISISGNTLTWVFPNGTGGIETRPSTSFAYGII